MCSGNGGHGAADLEPKLDLILWLGSLGLTCQGLLGFSAAFFKRMLLVVLCVCMWTLPLSLVGRLGKGQPEAKVPNLWELPARLPHRSPSHLLHLPRVCPPVCCLLLCLLRRRRRQQGGASLGASLAPTPRFSILEGRPPLGLLCSLSHTGCPINSATYLHSLGVDPSHKAIAIT